MVSTEKIRTFFVGITSPIIRRIFISRKLLLLATLSLLCVSGCGEKKVDPAKIEEVNKLIAGKDFDKGIPLIDDMAKASPSDETVKKTQIGAHMQYR